MIIIIDANNLLELPASRVTQSLRKNLCVRLARYAKSIGHKLYLVFDGGKSHEEKIVTTQLTLIDAGPLQTADSVIINLIQSFKLTAPSDPLSLIIITKDRLLREKVRQESIISLSPQQFLGRVLLREKKSPKTTQAKAQRIIQYPKTDYFKESQDPPQKTLYDTTFDALMLASLEKNPVPSKEPEESEKHFSRERESKTPSQQEKALAALLNKL